MVKFISRVYGSLMQSQREYPQVVETYRFAIEINYSKSIVEIEFHNQKFHQCRYDFTGTYTRDQWIALALIEKKITELENDYKEKAAAWEKYK